MGRFDNEDNYNPNMRQKDLVLSPNEYVFIQSKTNGTIKTYTGPIMVTISAQESMVIFDTKSKRFKETVDFETARQTFTSAPEGWYVVLKNPTKDNVYPDSAKAMSSPELMIGKKVNIAGPCSFSLFPGQMTRVVQGHKLRSNQYLIARVYDAEVASNSAAVIVDAEGNEIKDEKTQYFAGQLLVIKGTEVSFYMPPTGIEVIPTKNGSTYVRDAITLERLEYAILKDEDGEKRYVHGPAVVFPKPTETFVATPKGGNIFRALELSPISGIYVKVIADYVDNGVEHKTGEELFITGNDQMIYYPRPEHALIQYDGKYMHHAIAIPEGEGRYILDRLKGEIKTVTGPTMYLPDPRYEVVVKRKLSNKECNLIYPGNKEVLEYNVGLQEKTVEKLARMGKTTAATDAINTAYCTSNALDSLAIFEANANISRGVSYTKPRTITLDTKYDGVISVDVWTGYAVNVIAKDGTREVVVGPATRLLDYDETLGAFYDNMNQPQAFLPIKDNKIQSIITAQTKDSVNVRVKMAYYVCFDEEQKEKWFNVDHYTNYVTERMSNLIKRKIKEYDVQDFYMSYNDILRNLVLADGIYKFEENGMYIFDIDTYGIDVEDKIAKIINAHQSELIQKNLELADAEARMKVVEALTESERRELELRNENERYDLELNRQIKETRLNNDKMIAEREAAVANAKAQANLDLQELKTKIHDMELARQKALDDMEAEREKMKLEMEKERMTAYAEATKEIMNSIQPGLIEALMADGNAKTLGAVADGIAPYAMAKGESAADFVNTLFRGTTLEHVLEKFGTKGC